MFSNFLSEDDKRRHFYLWLAPSLATPKVLQKKQWLWSTKQLNASFLPSCYSFWATVRIFQVNGSFIYYSLYTIQQLTHANCFKFFLFFTTVLHTLSVFLSFFFFYIYLNNAFILQGCIKSASKDYQKWQRHL